MNRTVPWQGEHQRVLVTGGAGFIGSHVVEALRASGAWVEVLDDLSAGSPDNLPADVALHVGDIRSEETLRRIFREGRFTAVVHCAAQTSVERSMRDPELDWDINVVGTRRLAEAANTYGVNRFVFLSSGGAIYGETAGPADEQTMPAPRSYYGLHKYAAEEVLRSDGLCYAILRPANVYGSRQRADAEGGVVAVFQERLLAGEPVEIHGGGQQVRDFVHVSDVARAVLVALQTEANVTWNVASGEATRIIDLAEEMAALLGRPLASRHGPRRAGDVDRSLLSPAALLGTGRWGPPLRRDQGLRLTLAQRRGVAAIAREGERTRTLRPAPAPAPAL